MTGQEQPLEAARGAADAIRFLNHTIRPGLATEGVIDVADLYDLLAELALLTSRLPQLFGQVEDLLDNLVDHHQRGIVAGDHEGDPVAVAAICGHWLAASAGAAHELAYRVDQAQQNLTWAAPTST